jgi:general secretion pathway protein I
MTLRRRPARGFTLVEVLVALAIVAIALGAGAAAMSSLTRNTARQADVLLAQICADNALVQLRLLKQMPGIGSSSQACEQGGQSFEVLTEVFATPNPNFRRIEARVSLQGQPQLSVSTVLGRY